MCYLFKTLLMKKIIAGKQRKKPFDYDAGENFVLPKDADGMINNSYYFSAHNENTSFYCRLGIRSTHKEIWFYYSDQAVRLSFDDLNFKGDCPLVTVKDDKCWKVVYNGNAKDKNGVDVNVEFSADYTAREKAIDFFSHMPPVRTAMAMAGEKWNKEFFSEVQKNNQVHYEEFGVLNGTIKINGELKEFSLPCTRDHSFGKRDWNYMNNHLWLMAVSESSQLNFSMVSYPAMSILEVGNFKADGKDMAFVLSADYDRSKIITGEITKELDVKLKLNDKSTLNIKVKKQDQEIYQFQDGDYCLMEGVAEFEINGKNYRGIFEVGVNKDKKRIYNGKSVKKLRV